MTQTGSNRPARYERPTPLICPVCGRRMVSGDLRGRKFECPGCGERLRVSVGGTWLGFVASVLLAVVVPYLAGVSGYGFLWLSLILFFALFVAVSPVLQGILYPRLELDWGRLGIKMLRIPRGPCDPKDR